MKTTARKPCILIAEDDQAFMTQLAEALRDESYEVLCARDGHEALKILRENRLDMGLIDLAMPGVDGMEVLQQTGDKWPGIPMVMITGHASIDKAIQATRLGAYDFIEKPVALDRLLLTIERALEKKQLQQKSRWMAEEVLSRYQMVGSGAVMQVVYERIDRIAGSDSAIFITGETGTGKELAAMAIHMRSSRASHPFVKVNCAAIPETLIESELFGYKKGAFTGALNDFAGKFEQAEGGTIFLDEIGDLSAGAQAKLLRVLQSHEVTPLGSTRTVQVDVRVAAATNQNLVRMIESGRFRADLYYRICIADLHLPPLREHKEDIPELARFFLKKYNEEHNRCIRDFEPGALQILLQYHWPGNIRELGAVIERVFLFGAGDVVTGKDLAPLLQIEKQTEASSLLPYHKAREAFERDYIRQVLLAHDYNIQETAHALGIDRTNLYRKMQKLGLGEEET